MSIPDLTSKAKQSFIEASSRCFQALGFPRTTGQVYGFIYFSQQPISLDDMVEALKLSKGSASIATRNLLNFQAIRQIWVRGDRREYFEAVEDVCLVFRKLYDSFVTARIEGASQSISEMFKDLDEDLQKRRLSGVDVEFCRNRLEKIRSLQKRLDEIGPMIEKQFS